MDHINCQSRISKKKRQTIIHHGYKEHIFRRSHLKMSSPLASLYPDVL